MLSSHPPCFPSFLTSSLSHTHQCVMKQCVFCVCVCLRMKWVSWGLSPLSCEAQPNTAVSGFRSSAVHVQLCFHTITWMQAGVQNVCTHTHKRKCVLFTHLYVACTHLLHCMHTDAYSNTGTLWSMHILAYTQICPKAHAFTHQNTHFKV